MSAMRWVDYEVISLQYDCELADNYISDGFTNQWDK